MRLFRSFGPALWILGIVSSGALAQPAPPPGPSQNPVCVRLESQLSGLDRGSTDPARAEQVRRYEEAASKQQGELDQLTARSRRMGCEGGGFFALFTGQPPQCGPLNSQIQQMRANLDRMLTDLQRLQGGSADREGQRRALLVALAQNDCGPQYRQAAAPQSGGSFLEQLFSPGGFTPGDPLQSSTFRTICVRTCDGFYFPLSYSTNPSRFGEDENACRRLCPAAEVALYSHRNPGEDVRQAVSISGRPYTELPNAFRYRQAYDPACTCKRPGQSWTEALEGRDNTVERGDIVVTEDKAKALSQPPPARDAQGRPVRQDARKPDGKTPPGPAEPAAATAEEKEPDPGKRNVRSVGPTFLPAR
jgi:Protein of unknown function (DUF2865)